jgi:hypothetical protein
MGGKAIQRTMTEAFQNGSAQPLETYLEYEWTRSSNPILDMTICTFQDVSVGFVRI